MITTTLNRIKKEHPCNDGWKRLLFHLGKTKADDEPLPFATILESNGLNDALWCCQAEPQYEKEWRSSALWYMKQTYPSITEENLLYVLAIVERYANGTATKTELEGAYTIASKLWTIAEIKLGFIDPAAPERKLALENLWLVSDIALIAQEESALTVMVAGYQKNLPRGVFRKILCLDDTVITDTIEPKILERRTVEFLRLVTEGRT